MSSIDLMSRTVEVDVLVDDMAALFQPEKCPYKAAILVSDVVSNAKT